MNSIKLRPMEPSYATRTYKRTDMTKLIVALRKLCENAYRCTFVIRPENRDWLKTSCFFYFFYFLFFFLFFRFFFLSLSLSLSFFFYFILFFFYFKKRRGSCEQSVNLR